MADEGTTAATADRRWKRLYERLRAPGLRRAALWDVFMVLLAVVYLALLTFDTTYLRLRTRYLRVAPGVVALYDPIKGIRPAPSSQHLLRQVLQVDAYVSGTSTQTLAPQALGAQVSELRRLTLRVLRESVVLGDVVREVVAESAGIDPAEMHYPPTQRVAVQVLWPKDPRVLASRLDRVDAPLLQALRADYYRDVDASGQPTDHFAWLELPFLVVFWLDFSLGWAMTVREREPGRRWYDYPLRHWYDLIGLLPGGFRVFRLFRLASLYVRIYRGELRQTRDNALQRFAQRVSELLTEEVTNQVQLRVVAQLEHELEQRTLQRALEASLVRHRAELEAAILDMLERAVSDPRAQGLVRELAALTTRETLTSVRSWPMARGVTRSVVDRAVVAGFAAATRTLQSSEGRAVLRRLVETWSEGGKKQPSYDQLQTLVASILFDVVHAFGIAALRRRWTASEGDAFRSPDPRDHD